MRIIDCESVTTTYYSIGHIFGTSRQLIDNVFENLGPDICDGGSSDVYTRPDCLVLSELERRAGELPPFDGAFWFHITRTHTTNTFQEGIQPLAHYINSIWGFLFSLVENKVSYAEWKDFRTRVETDHPSHHAGLYRLKTGNRRCWGPCAMLIRELSFKPQEVRNHDYLASPEIVEDICVCFQDTFKVNLQRLFQQATKPCIVKFIHYDSSREYLQAALFYLYRAYYEIGLPSRTPCFDGRGKVVPRENIVKVEFV